VNAICAHVVRAAAEAMNSRNAPHPSRVLMLKNLDNPIAGTSITGNGTLGNLALVITIVVAAIGWGNSTLLPMSERISFLQRIRKKQRCR
jgi:hypothetical protein